MRKLYAWITDKKFRKHSSLNYLIEINSISIPVVQEEDDLLLIVYSRITIKYL